MRDASGCVGCGAPLPPGSGVREVTCAFCKKVQEHPRPIEAGQEVMVSGRLDRYELARVIEADGPDRVSVETDEGTETLRVEDVVMVTRGAVRPGDRVYARGLIGWELRYVASVDGDQVTVKQPDGPFSDSFFDDAIPAERVRLPVEPTRRVRRTRIQAWIARAKGDPIGFGMKLLVAVIALWLAQLFVRALVLVIFFD